MLEAKTSVLGSWGDVNSGADVDASGVVNVVETDSSVVLGVVGVVEGVVVAVVSATTQNPAKHKPVKFLLKAHTLPSGLGGPVKQ